MRWLAVGLALLAAGVQAANDLLILRDGTERRGNLQWCNSQQCQLDEAQIPQDAVAWIGFDGAKAPAPRPRNPAQNELHLRSGSVEPALVVALDPQSVYTDRGMRARREVAWIHLAAAPLASGAAAPRRGSGPEESFPRAYVWEGRIEVENVYEGRNGRHRWRAEYALRLLEHPRDYSRFYRDNVRGFLLEPQHLAYRIVADQHYDRGAFAKDTVVMRGEASGTFTAAQLAGGRVLVADVHELTAPGHSGGSTALTFASAREYLEFVNDRAGPGAYNVNIGFINYRNDGPWSRVRNLYRGIDRSGSHPLFFPNDPDQDFIHWVPASMPDGTNVIGRLASPDQAEVSGSVSYAIGGGVSGGDHEPQRVALRWSFRRTPRQPRRRGLFSRRGSGYDGRRTAGMDVTDLPLTEEEKAQITLRLAALETEHRDLDQVIGRLAGDPAQDQLQLRRLKKRKLFLKDQIQRLRARLIPDIIA